MAYLISIRFRSLSEDAMVSCTFHCELMAPKGIRSFKPHPTFITTVQDEFIEHLPSSKACQSCMKTVLPYTEWVSLTSLAKVLGKAIFHDCMLISIGCHHRSVFSQPSRPHTLVSFLMCEC